MISFPVIVSSYVKYGAFGISPLFLVLVYFIFLMFFIKSEVVISLFENKMCDIDKVFLFTDTKPHIFSGKLKWVWYLPYWTILFLHPLAIVNKYNDAGFLYLSYSVELLFCALYYDELCYFVSGIKYIFYKKKI